VPEEVDLIDVTPHMHFLGKEVQVTATLPGGAQKPLVRIADWDFRWQSLYVFREPVRLPAGTRVDAWYRFDNSAANPANPSSPPRRVRWGPKTTDEMVELVLTVVPRQAEHAGQFFRAAEATWARSPAPPLGWKASRDARGALTVVTSPPFDVRAALAQLETLRPWQPDVQRLLAQAAEEGQSRELLDLVAAWARSRPEDVQALTMHGQLLALSSEARQDPQTASRLAREAQAAFDRALQVSPTSWDARFAKAIGYRYAPAPLGSPSEAIKHFELLLEQQERQRPQPHFAITYLNLAELYAQTRDGKKAAAIRARGAKLFPANEDLSAPETR
jgi:hypothetical protein